MFVEEENQEEQVEQLIKNTGVIAEQQVEPQLETQENNEEAVDDGEEVQLQSENTVDPVPEQQDEDQLETHQNNQEIQDEIFSDAIDNVITPSSEQKKKHLHMIFLLMILVGIYMTKKMIHM